IMDSNARIYVAGHRGLAGSALARRLKAGGCRDIVTRTHAELDLTDTAAVKAFFASEKPEYVFLAAAKVGGILANRDHPAEFIQSNPPTGPMRSRRSRAWRCAAATTTNTARATSP